MNTHDPKCYDLAHTFLADEPLSDAARARLADRLASEIQNAIESFLDHDEDLRSAVTAASAERTTR